MCSSDLRFRNGKGDVDRLHLVDHQHRRVIGLDVAPREHQHCAGNAIHGRADGGKAQLYLGKVHRCFGILQCGGEGIDRCLVAIDRRGRDEAALGQIALTFEIGACLGQLRLIAR